MGHRNSHRRGKAPWEQACAKRKMRREVQVGQAMDDRGVKKQKVDHDHEYDHGFVLALVLALVLAAQTVEQTVEVDAAVDGWDGTVDDVEQPAGLRRASDCSIREGAGLEIDANATGPTVLLAEGDACAGAAGADVDAEAARDSTAKTMEEQQRRMAVGVAAAGGRGGGDSPLTCKIPAVAGQEEEEQEEDDASTPRKTQSAVSSEDGRCHSTRSCCHVVGAPVATTRIVYPSPTKTTTKKPTMVQVRHSRVEVAMVEA